MNIKEEVKEESSCLNLSFQNERQFFIEHPVKVKIETVTSSSDIKSELEDSTYPQDEEPHLLRFNEIIKESEIETRIDIKEENWLERTNSCVNDGIKDETHEGIYSTKQTRLVPEIKNSNNFEKLETKEEESLPDDVAPQNATKFFRKVVSMKNSDAVLLEDHCGVPIKTEIKSEAPFTKHLVKQIKSEAVICSNNWEIDRKAVIDEQTLISDFGSRSEEELLSEDPVTKLRKFNSDPEMGSKIEIKEESLWLKTEASDMCDNIKAARLKGDFCVDSGPGSTSQGQVNSGGQLSVTDVAESSGGKWKKWCDKNGDFPPVKSSRLCTQGVSTAVSGKSPLIAAEVSGTATSFYPGNANPEYECQKSDDTGIPTAEEHVLSEESGKCSEKKDMYIRPLNLNQKRERPHKYETSDQSFTWLEHLITPSFIHDGKKPHQCKTCGKSFTQLGNLKRHSLIHNGRKPQQCKTCDKSFTSLSLLKIHYLIHQGKKPYQCKTCDKSFPHLSSLMTHYLIHDGKNPHQCKTCSKSFTQLGNLKTHSLIHEGKKAYQCKTGNRSFTQLENLKTRHTNVKLAIRVLLICQI